MALITVSDTRSASDDLNGRWLADAVIAIGARLVYADCVPDEPVDVVGALERALGAGARLVVFNGGTGVAPRDTTVDAIAPRLDRVLPGFGELFRLLSWEQIGSAAMLSRALSGIVGRSAVFCLPGSHKAVQLGWERLIAPEIRHILSELDRGQDRITTNPNASG